MEMEKAQQREDVCLSGRSHRSEALESVSCSKKIRAAEGFSLTWTKKERRHAANVRERLRRHCLINPGKPLTQAAPQALLGVKESLDPTLEDRRPTLPSKPSADSRGLEKVPVDVTAS
ncbi:hypothetical protein SRHO_G00224340 [Serrasalmus rhombeus]